MPKNKFKTQMETKPNKASVQTRVIL